MNLPIKTSTSKGKGMISFKGCPKERDFVMEAYIAFATLSSGIPKTKTQKLFFLAEIEYYARHGKRMTELEYVSYFHGPFNVDIASILDSLFLDERVKVIEKNTSTLVASKKQSVNVHLVKDRLEVIEFVYEKFGQLSLEEISTLVYRTAVYASTPFGEIIDFQSFNKENIKEQIPVDAVLSSKEKKKEGEEIQDLIKNMDLPEFVG